MATPPDIHQDADYRALVDALAREGLPRRAEAARALEAVICALALRISGSDFDELRELLPEPFRTRLAPCERHASAPPSRALRTAEDFYAVVAEDLRRDPADVEPVIHAVFAAVRAQLAEREGEAVSRELPPELQALWRRPS